MSKQLNLFGSAEQSARPKSEQRARSTGIEWTEHTWNPFVGCSILSSGCKNCYAMALAERLAAMGQKKYEGLTKRASNGKVVWTGKIALSGKATFEKPLQMSKPSIFFVNSMSDFFHSDAPFDFQLKAWQLMEKANWHQYQVLTKRPENIQAFLNKLGRKVPDHIWLGATVESGSVAKRIDIVRALDCKIRFLSIEPLIAPLGPVSLKGIQWIISGGESGAGARPMQLDWMREVRDIALRDKVPHFFKQWGIAQNNPIYLEAPEGISGSAWVKKMDAIGKGGSLLDGKHYKQMPFGFKVADFEEMQDDSWA